MKRILLSMFFFFMILFGGFVSANLAVTSLYSSGFPLEMYPGQKMEISFTLDNVILGEGGDLVIGTELLEGEEIASFIEKDKEYEIPLGGKEEVGMVIKIPKKAIPGASYRIKVLFKPSFVSTDDLEEGGNVQFVTNIGKIVPVRVVEKPTEAPIFEVFGDESGISALPTIAWFVIVFVFLTGIVIVGILLVRSIRRKSLNNI